MKFYWMNIIKFKIKNKVLICCIDVLYKLLISIFKNFLKISQK